MKKVLFAALLLGLAAGAPTGSASAGESVPFNVGGLPEEYRPDVEGHVFSWEPDLLKFLPEGFDDEPEEERLRYLRDNVLEWALYDLNDDGVPELIVKIGLSYACGTIGCASFIFRRAGGRWVMFQEASIGSDSVVVASKRPSDGSYRTFLGGELIYRWNGKEYEPYCWYRCQPSQTLSLKREMGSEANFLKHYFYETYGAAELFRSGKLGLEDLRIGHHDLNGDGRPELFVKIDKEALQCPWEGCETFIFQENAGQWQLIGRLKASSLYINHEITFGYHVLHGRAQKLVWNGTAYELIRCDDFCSTRQDTRN